MELFTRLKDARAQFQSRNNMDVTYQSTAENIVSSLPKLTVEGQGRTWRVRFAGDWKMRQGGAPDVASLRQKISEAQQITFDLSGVGAWDTSLVALLYGVVKEAQKRKIECQWEAVPDGVQGLLRLAFGQGKETTAAEEKDVPWLDKLGYLALEMVSATERVATFIGEMTLSAGRLIRRKAYFRKVDFIEALADAGPRALPIVTLISFLVGLILAFVGSMQLQQFGAQIFVANLVGVAMTREMGAMMTGIIMAGRTGASYAARIGTMQVNEEVDALRTNGMEPVDFLALPRILALLLMVPVLCVYADAVGIAGGMAIGVGMLDLSPVEYWNQTVKATRMVDCWAGLMKSIVFSLVVGFAGCYHGLRCGRSSEAVGRVTTTAVVSAIVFIVITDALLTVVYNALDF